MRRRLHPMLGVMVAAWLLPGGPLTAQERPSGEPPPPLPPVSLAIPPTDEFTLDNGLHVLLVHDPTLPLVSAGLYIPGGGSAEPVGREGLASMTAGLLNKGTPTRSAEEIAMTIEGVGGTLGAFSGDDFIGVTSSVLSDDLELALALLAEITLHPTFPEEEVELARTRTLSSLRAAQGQPQQIALRRFFREIYGGHPYGRLAEPTSVESLRRDEVVDFHRRTFRPGGSLLVLSGDVARDQAEELARSAFGTWPAGVSERSTLPDLPDIEETTFHLVHRPGSVQTTIFAGHLGILPDDPDYFALEVANRILGGGTDSRLFQVLREERGWTYGANSLFIRNRDRGFFVVVTEVRTEVTDSTLTELFFQLERLRDEPVPPEEFQAARDYLAGSFPLRLETPGQIAGQLAEARLLGVGEETFTEYPDRIREVTPEAAREAARARIRPDRMTVVLVGDAMRVLPMVEGMGPVVLTDVEGRSLDPEALSPPATAGAASLRPELLEPQTRRYRVMVQGNPAGSVNQTLTRDGGDWLAEILTQGALGQQESSARFDAEGLTPRESRQSIVQGPMSIRMELEVVGGRAVGSATLPPEAGGDRQIDLALPPGGLLPGMDDFLLVTADFGPDAAFSLPVLDVSTGAFQTLTFRVTGVEQVTVPAGSYSTYRVEMTGGQIPMVLFVREAAPHVLIRQEFEGAPVTLELESLSPG